MGKSNRDDGVREPRHFRQPRAFGSGPSSPPKLHPHLVQPAMYSLNGTSYFPHPCGYHGRNADDHCGNSEGSRRTARSRPSPKLGVPKEKPPTPPAPIGPSINVNAELKVSLAAKHLASQVSESKTFWIAFQERFEKEIAGIKYYASDDILQQIWQKRVEHDNKYKNGENQDDEQFSIQRMKLEACLDQINEAARAFVQSRPLDNRFNHDPRHLALEKIRGTGSLVLNLAARSAVNSSACADLVTEASNLEKLVDPKSEDAKVLHRLDRRETKRSVPGGEQTRSTAGSTWNEPAPLEVQDMFSQEIVVDEAGNGDGWDLGSNRTNREF
ncbi:hypothetical protein F4819DRAFT_458273 [Hypoxylon fuscum]|nr:hypothetical protein F4819DRAFT_458273 [Hypoxylon fuscum]